MTNEPPIELIFEKILLDFFVDAIHAGMSEETSLADFRKFLKPWIEKHIK